MSILLNFLMSFYATVAIRSFLWHLEAIQDEKIEKQRKDIAFWKSVLERRKLALKEMAENENLGHEVDKAVYSMLDEIGVKTEEE